MRLINSQEESNCIGSFLKKYYWIFLFVCGFVFFLQTYMAIRFGVKYGVEFNGYFLKFLAYVVLAWASLITGIILFLGKKKDYSNFLMNVFLHIYIALLVCYSAIISYYDAMNGNSIIVYLTIIVMAGGIAINNPLVYTTEVLISYVILATSLFDKNVYFTDSANFINITIFVILSIVLCFRRYYVTIKEFTLQEKLTKLSYLDQLTSVYNRRTLEIRLTELEEKGTPYIIGMIDVDNFKSINDTFGHDKGDEVVQKVAELMIENFGVESSFRYGGDEFTVVVTEPLDDIALDTKFNAINFGLKQFFTEKRLSISAGFYRNAEGNLDYRKAIKKADEALYISKENGKCKNSIM